MFNNIRLSKLFGTVIYLHPLWFLVLVLYCLPSFLQGDYIATLQALAVIVGAYGSVVAHEYAHIFTARAYGIKTPSMLIHLFGGAAHLTRIPWGLPEACIAIAGPIFSAIVGALLLLSSNELFQLIGYINMILACFNLIPLPPLDGGRVVRGILYALTGKLVLSTRIVTYFGLFVVLPIVCTFFLPLTLWVVVLVFIICMMSVSELRYIEKTYGGEYGSRPSNHPFDRN